VARLVINRSFHSGVHYETYRNDCRFFAMCALTAAPIAVGQRTSPTTTTSSDDHRQMQHGEMDHGKTDHPDGHGKQGSQPSREFAMLDINKDGHLSKAELAKHALAPHFGMLDANKDGRLSPAEFNAGKGM
jgi:EF hand